MAEKKTYNITLFKKIKPGIIFRFEGKTMVRCFRDNQANTMPGYQTILMINDDIIGVRADGLNLRP